MRTHNYLQSFTGSNCRHRGTCLSAVANTAAAMTVNVVLIIVATAIVVVVVSASVCKDVL